MRVSAAPVAIVLALLSVAIAPTDAHAQTVDPSNHAAFLSSVSSTTTTTIVGGIIVTVTISSGSADLERYLRHNAVAVRHDITRGAGAAVEDLADGFGVASEHLAAFGQLLRARRQELLALSDDHVLDADSAAQFAALVIADAQAAGILPGDRRQV